MHSNKIVYRLLKDEDKHLFRQLRLESLEKFPENFGTTYEEELNRIVPEFEDILSNSESHDFVFGAFDNSDLIGICNFAQEKKFKRLHEGFISQVYVMPLYIGKGIASKLMQLSVEKAFKSPNIEHILLGVVNSNPAAISIYKKLGFQQYGIIENYFKVGDEYWTQVFMILTIERYRDTKF